MTLLLLKAKNTAILTALSVNHRASTDVTNELVRLFYVWPQMGFLCSMTVTITDISLQMYLVRRPPAQCLIYFWRSI